MTDPAGALSGVTIGRYRLGALLGRGGMGEVYRAEDSDLQRWVALKVLPAHLVDDPDRLARFVKEARAASSLNHPNLVSIYEVGAATPPGAPRPVHYIAMELVDGRTLRQLLQDEPHDRRKLLDYAIQAADALSAAHAAGIIHRDLKPENLMIAAGGYLKILDFGLAKLRAEPALLQAASQESTMAQDTTPGIVMGTVGYMSPEQAQGRAIDQRSDIFSFGCVLYEIASGARAFAGRTAVDTLHQIIHQDPPPLAGRATHTPPELQRIVSKCLAKDPEERYQSMKEAAIDLRGLRRQLESGSAPAVRAAAPARGRRAIWIGLLAAALVVVAGVATYRYGFGRRAADAPGLAIERLTALGTVIDAVISPDGNNIVYVESAGGLQSLQLRQINGSRAIELVPAARVGFWGIAFARDGQSVYYGLRSPAHPTGALFKIPVLGGTPRQILTGIDSAVTMSPDGQRFAFYRVDPSVAASSAIVVADADGSNQRILASKQPPEFFAPGFFVAPSWSPDGARIAAFVRNSSTRDAHLLTIDLEGGAEAVFPERYFEGTNTEWLPDGSGILFTARRSGMWGSGNGGQIFLQPYPSGAVRRITNDVIEYRTVSLTADGRQLVTVGYDVAVRMSVLSPDSGEERPLRSERYDGARGMAWSPDGSRIYFSQVAGGRTRIGTMSIDGRDRRDFVTDEGSSWPAMAPDGRTFAYVASRDGRIGIWRTGPDGGDPRLLAAIPDATHLAFSADSRHVYFASSIEGAPATYRVAVDGGPHALVARRFARAAVSPDGSLLAGIYRAQPSSPVSLGVLRAETGEPVKSFPDFEPTASVGSIGWSVDGSEIYYTTVERYNIWRRKLAGGAPEKLTRFTDLAIFRFERSPNGRDILLSRGAQTRDAFLITGFR